MTFGLSGGDAARAEDGPAHDAAGSPTAIAAAPPARRFRKERRVIVFVILFSFA